MMRCVGQVGTVRAEGRAPLPVPSSRGYTACSSQCRPFIAVPRSQSLRSRQLRPLKQHVKAEASSASASEEPENKDIKGFERTRWITFIGIFFGYASYYITRNSLNAVNPVLLEDPVLGFDKTQVGGLTSVMPVAYGFSKGLSGFAGGKFPPRVLLAGGLMATAVVNVLFGVGASYTWFLVFWAANGLLQGLGAPACARMLTSWYPSTQRGKFWSLWTASNNIGGFAAPIIAGYAAKHYGWRYGMYVPGAIGIVVGLFVLATMKDSPEAAGYPPVEDAAPKKSTKAAKPKDSRSVWEVIRTEVLSSPWVWLFAITYFFVYVIRQGVTTWFIFYLKEVKGITDAAQAAGLVSGLELGGLVGSLSAGAISDILVARNAANGGKTGSVGLRTRVVLAYTAATAVMLFAFANAPNIPALQAVLVAGVGCALYGPQMLIGLCGAECVSQSAVSACQGLLGWISYLGAASAGVPLAYIVKQLGWSSFFTALIGCCVASLVLCLPMINLKSYKQKEAEADA